MIMYEYKWLPIEPIDRVKGKSQSELAANYLEQFINKLVMAGKIYEWTYLYQESLLVG